ncbi:TetR/AcrR family transcriptional regulator [Actinoplanes couchii]|uniref:TetR family transcriptional regulator n=1 Tax=Actinoplanes couchii TaxID=403638 RepID=A0ABQ3X1Y8_9ACTN|nr:TetR/AcrR family transcriptional regulator [Actinoplanes couchii]MDR6316920.1 AcrR family transcriptional regulator [Actinoplanes couchii]GID52527.1 TetR family transcriptional regulator [Actinoplanes couchii]
MGRSEAARTALLDAAERLFAESGIAQVSDRRVAEEAGNTNHSAVRYYFAGRDGLLRALFERHTTAVDERRRDVRESGDSVLSDVRQLIMPTMMVLDTLPRPSWRARFIGQALHDPVMQRLVREASSAESARLAASLAARLSDLDPAVVTGRAVLITRIVATATADVEARTERDGSDPQWPAVGSFLADAIAGMLAAEISPAGHLNPLPPTRP